MAKKNDKPAEKPEATEKVKNWAEDKTSDLYEKVSGWYEQIAKAYENRKGADESIAEYWSIFNAEPDSNQMYEGNSKCYLPVVRDAICARAKRAVRQLFPNKYKHVEAVGTDNQDPKARVAILEHHIRVTRLKSIVRSMLVAGDVTGQWNLYVDWHSTTRHISRPVAKQQMALWVVDPESGKEVSLTDDADDEQDEEVTHEGIELVDFATEDLVVLPPTSTIDKCDISCLKLRMSKEQVKDMIDRGVFIDPGEDTDIGDWMADRKGNERQVPDKKRVGDAGIKTEGTLKYALVYWAQAYLDLDGDGKTCLADIYYAGEDEVLGIIKAPQWGQKRSILSAPVERIAGSFNGISKVEGVKRLQWNLNDFWNMGQDSAAYAMMPITMTDPVKNPNYQMMVLGLAAIWPVDPNSTKFASFPSLWKDAAGMCENIKHHIQESLDVNPMMMGQMPKGRKNAPVMGAQQQEQSVSVIDHAERFEEEILNPLMELIAEYDAQFRDKDLTVISKGELGAKLTIETYPPQQWGERYFYQWTGTDFVMSMPRMQQQIATMNVLRGIPPQQLGGRRLDITPILERIVDNVFGPELGQRILVDERNKFSIPSELENEMMFNGVMVEAHEADDHMGHIRDHQESARLTGDHAGLHRTHIQQHMMMLQKQRQMAAGAPQGGGQPGMPGGAGPGVAGTPRMGAQPAPQRPVQQPPGALPQGSSG